MQDPAADEAEGEELEVLDAVPRDHLSGLGGGAAGDAVHEDVLAHLGRALRLGRLELEAALARVTLVHEHEGPALVDGGAQLAQTVGAAEVALGQGLK